MLLLSNIHDFNIMYFLIQTHFLTQTQRRTHIHICVRVYIYLNLELRLFLLLVIPPVALRIFSLLLLLKVCSSLSLPLGVSVVALLGLSPSISTPLPQGLASGLPHCQGSPLTKPKCVVGGRGLMAAYLGISPGLPVLFYPSVTAPHFIFLCLFHLSCTISPVGHLPPSSHFHFSWPGSCPSSSIPCCLFGTVLTPPLSLLSSFCLSFLLSLCKYLGVWSSFSTFLPTITSVPLSPSAWHLRTSLTSTLFLCACFLMVLIPSASPPCPCVIS